MLMQELPEGTWMTWIDRRSPILVLRIENGMNQFGGILPVIGTEVVRIAWKGSQYTLEGKQGEVKETLIYTGVSTGDFWTRKHTFKKKKQ